MIAFHLTHPTLVLGIVSADGVRCGPSDPRLSTMLTEAATRVAQDAGAFSESMRVAVRDVLRAGGYKPTGRGKPASEFLLGAAKSGELPRINNLVDLNNLASLEYALPISIFDRALLGDDVGIRFGERGESYVFNSSGQSMDIAGLPVVCRGPAREPVGNAVKDSMLTKVSPATTSVLVVAYGPRDFADLVRSAAQRLGALLEEHAGARQIEVGLLP
jgi:DNA/RNA-binding domain of Phe-tRNA-synthetase-like protein